MGSVRTDLICPLCESKEFEDISPTQDNGIFGPGFSSWKLVDLWACTKCRIVVNPTKPVPQQKEPSLFEPLDMPTPLEVGEPLDVPRHDLGEGD